MEPLTGKVGRLVRARGFGFIVADPPLGGDPGNTQVGEELFFHFSGLIDSKEFATLEEGDRVNFTPMDSPKGRRAEEIRVMRRA